MSSQPLASVVQFPVSGWSGNENAPPKLRRPRGGRSYGVLTLRSHDNGANPRACLDPSGPLTPHEFAERYEEALVEDARIQAGVDLTGRVGGFLALAESPIELALAQQIVLAGYEGPRVGGWFLSDAGDLDIFLGSFAFEMRRSFQTIFAGVAPQVFIPRLDWRVDFLIVARRYGSDSRLCLIVECDGHDFHERTPGQAARDRSRDRRAQNAGMKVLRFTGREIWRSPRACMDEIENCLLGLLSSPMGQADG